MKIYIRSALFLALIFLNQHLFWAQTQYATFNIISISPGPSSCTIAINYTPNTNYIVNPTTVTVIYSENPLPANVSINNLPTGTYYTTTSFYNSQIILGFSPYSNYTNQDYYFTSPFNLPFLYTSNIKALKCNTKYYYQVMVSYTWVGTTPSFGQGDATYISNSSFFSTKMSPQITGNILQVPANLTPMVGGSIQFGLIGSYIMASCPFEHTIQPSNVLLAGGNGYNYNYIYGATINQVIQPNAYNTAAPPNLCPNPDYPIEIFLNKDFYTQLSADGPPIEVHFTRTVTAVGCENTNSSTASLDVVFIPQNYFPTDAVLKSTITPTTANGTTTYNVTLTFNAGSAVNVGAYTIGWQYSTSGLATDNNDSWQNLPITGTTLTASSVSGITKYRVVINIGNNSFGMNNNISRSIQVQDAYQNPQVMVGKQIWMTNDLSVTKFNDGYTTITECTPNIWGNNSYQATYYNNSGTYYYNSYVIKNNNVCPSGWSVPTTQDFTTLNNSSNFSTVFVSDLTGYINLQSAITSQGSEGIWWDASFYDWYVRSISSTATQVLPANSLGGVAGFAIRCIKNP